MPMILGKLWRSIKAQINKGVNVIWSADPIAQMQYEYDLAVTELKNGREGLEQHRALVERVSRCQGQSLPGCQRSPNGCPLRPGTAARRTRARRKRGAARNARRSLSQQRRQDQICREETERSSHAHCPLRRRIENEQRRS